MPRPKELFSITQQGMFYDAKTNLTMPRLDSGIPDLTKLKSRGDSTRKFKESCIDMEKAVQAQTERFRPRFVNLTNFKK
jgi:hypothetical protein